MKKILSLLLFVVFLVSHQLSAKHLKRKTLIVKLNADKESLFVVNGIAYTYLEKRELNDVLKKIDIDKVTDVTILKYDGRIPHQKNDVIVISYATLLEESRIQEEFRKIKEKFTDEYHGFSNHIHLNAKDPVLYFNGTKINHAEVKGLFDSIDINKIGYISYSASNNRKELHGQNGSNGIVIIWTKDKL